MSQTPPRFDRVRGLRDVLTATGAGIYLAAHVAGPMPSETVAAVHESDEMELRVGRGGPDREDDLAQREREARAVVAAALKGSPERIVLTHGAAEAARLAALEVLERHPEAQRVLLVEGLDAVLAAAVRDVADVAAAEVEIVARVPRIVSADVALVVMAHVDRDGRRFEIQPVVASARKAGARLLLDVGYSVGAFPTDVVELGADIVIGDGHRWLLGPEAVGFAWLAPSLGEELPEWLRLARAPFARGALLALARSVGWLLMYVELPWAVERTVALAEQLYADLGDIEGVELVAAPDAHGAVAAFRVRGWDAEAVADELGRSVFAILEADAERDLVRASVGAWNRERELERFVERLSEIARHTPETLPRRPSLTIIDGSTHPEPDG